MKSDRYARNILGPEELRLAGEAFEAALAEVGESDLHPYEIRKSLAQHIMQKIFAGERDAQQLHDGALARMRALEAQENMQAVRVTPISSNENIRPLIFAKG